MSSHPKTAAKPAPLDQMAILDQAPVRRSGRNAVFRAVSPPNSDGQVATHPADGQADIFLDGDTNQPRVLRGICVYSGATRLAELAARVGFETVWIEMEHGPADFVAVEGLCMAIEA